MLRQVANDVTANAVNDVMLRINDVSLREKDVAFGKHCGFAKDVALRANL